MKRHSWVYPLYEQDKQYDFGNEGVPYPYQYPQFEPRGLNGDPHSSYEQPDDQKDYMLEDLESKQCIDLLSILPAGIIDDDLVERVARRYASILNRNRRLGSSR